MNSESQFCTQSNRFRTQSLRIRRFRLTRQQAGVKLQNLEHFRILQCSGAADLYSLRQHSLSPVGILFFNECLSETVRSRQDGFPGIFGQRPDGSPQRAWKSNWLIAAKHLRQLRWSLLALGLFLMNAIWLRVREGSPSRRNRNLDQTHQTRLLHTVDFPL
jgi:hypothetical protein